MLAACWIFVGSSKGGSARRLGISSKEYGARAQNAGEGKRPWAPALLIRDACCLLDICWLEQRRQCSEAGNIQQGIWSSSSECRRGEAALGSGIVNSRCLLLAGYLLARAKAAVLGGWEYPARNMELELRMPERGSCPGFRHC